MGAVYPTLTPPPTAPLRDSDVLPCVLTALAILTAPTRFVTPVTPRVPVWMAEVTVVPTVKDETASVLVARPGETLMGVPFVMSGVDT